jgi:pimeloyl-CoA dehydrogenase small subunit
MDFDLSDDQRLLKDSVDRLIGDRYGFEQRKKSAREPEGWSRAMWREFSELGLLGLPFSEADGGFGGGPVETAIVMEAFGRGLVLEPFFSTVVLCGGLLRHAAGDGSRDEMIPGIIAGEKLLAFAHLERQSRYDLFDVATTATRDGAGWLLTGEKGLVLHGDTADKIFVSARTAGGRRDRAGMGLFRVDANARGVSRRGYPLQDGSRAAEISFSGARATEFLGDPEGALPVMEKVVDAAIAALCAEAVGVMAEMHATTVDYMKTRKQFGRAIGEFQALQHRAVDMYVALEQARSMSLYATMMADASDPAERRRAVSATKVQIGRSGKKIGQEAVQLHGGIAMTDEYKVGHFFKRMTMLDILFGDADRHLGIVADGESLFGS